MCVTVLNSKKLFFRFDDTLKEPVNFKHTPALCVQNGCHVKKFDALTIIHWMLRGNVQGLVLSYNKVWVKFYTCERIHHPLLSPHILSPLPVFPRLLLWPIYPMEPRPRSSVGGREEISANLIICLLYIYTSYELVPLLTWAPFIGDNESKRWDASRFPPSPTAALFHLSFPQGWFTTCDPCGCLVENRQQSVWDENQWAVVG